MITSVKYSDFFAR